MIKAGLILLTLTAISANVQADEVIRGKAKIVNGTTMLISGKQVVLAHIKTVQPGTACVWKNRPLDCGVLARSGLQDLVVGAQVSCRKAKVAAGRVCRAGGFDLAFGLVHAGWAVPSKSAPKYYFSRAAKAKKRALALWGAKDKQGRIVAELLSQ